MVGWVSYVPVDDLARLDLSLCFLFPYSFPFLPLRLLLRLARRLDDGCACFLLFSFFLLRLFSRLLPGLSCMCVYELSDASCVMY